MQPTPRVTDVNTPTPWLSAAEVAMRLGVSRRTFDAVTRHMPGFPEPFRPSPRKARWDWRLVERWRDAQSSAAISSALSA